MKQAHDEGTVVVGSDQSVPFQFPQGTERYWGDPSEGQEAWFEIGRDLPRELRTYTHGEWVPDPNCVEQG